MRLKWLFGGMLLLLVGGMFWSMDQRGMMAAVGVMQSERWFWVTILDLYVGLILASIWMMSREKKWGVRGTWLVVFLGLGNMGVLLYLLAQLYRRKPLVQD